MTINIAYLEKEIRKAEKRRVKAEEDLDFYKRWLEEKKVRSARAKRIWTLRKLRHYMKEASPEDRKKAILKLDSDIKDPDLRSAIGLPPIILKESGERDYLAEIDQLATLSQALWNGLEEKQGAF